MKRMSLMIALTVVTTPVVAAGWGNLPAPVNDADYYEGGEPAADKIELGRMLFFDKILSGNKNIACATCHHPTLGTGDGLALPLGEGPMGLGPERAPGETVSTAVHGRVPRNSPALFNLGAREFERMFHDGRVETDPEGYYEGGFITPAKWKLPTGLDNVLAAQAMFPVTSPAEMAGDQGENPVANAVSLNNNAGPDGTWERLGERLRGIPAYVEMFKKAYPNEVRNASDVTYVLAANAIAAFETSAFRADNSPFDEFLRGNPYSMTPAQRRGMTLFYGKAGCSGCHSGKFQTDHDFHAIAMPQIGPGKADGTDASYWEQTGLPALVEDYGRGRVTYRTEDNFKFRTPSLRNVTLTGPWGHAGAYDRLEDVIRHHLDPVTSLHGYRADATNLPPLGVVVELTAEGSRLSQGPMSASRRTGFLRRDTWVQENARLRDYIALANELEPLELSDGDVADLVAFLESLTDPSSKDVGALVPKNVPSGLPVAD